jgi:hypothetical protein
MNRERCSCLPASLSWLFVCELSICIQSVGEKDGGGRWEMGDGLRAAPRDGVGGDGMVVGGTLLAGMACLLERRFNHQPWATYHLLR